MSEELTPEQERMWERLKYVPKTITVDNDVNSLYAHQIDVVLNVSRGVEPVNVEFKVLKNRPYS